jgi:AcrR family transcriptional regulator
MAVKQPRLIVAGHLFRMLFMRTAPVRRARSEADLTARARIRDAAIECFAEDGFDASFRTIAARAGVSPALITHHFGSKTELRAECDAEVLRQYRQMKSEGIDEPSTHLLAALSAPGLSAPILVYVLRAILSGGAPARAFLDHLISDMRQVMADGVSSGFVRPSRDEEARLRYLTYQSMGALIVQFVTMTDATPEEFVASLSAGQQETILPTLELYTEGFLADRSMLDDYLAHIAAPRTSSARTSSARTSSARTSSARTAPTRRRTTP